MFYLKMLKNFYKSNAVRSTNFIFLTVIVICFVSKFDGLKIYFDKKLFPGQAHIYFNALVENGNIGALELKSKLTRLPGVDSVKLQEPEKLQGKVKELVENLEVNFPTSLLNTKFYGLRVILDKRLNIDSQNLILGFLEKIVGQNNLTVSPLKTASFDGKSKSKWRNFLENYYLHSLFIILTMFWFLGVFSIRTGLMNFSYLIEEYQRRSNVAVKLISVFLSLIISSTLVIGDIFWNFNLYNFILITFFIFISSLLLFKKSTWP